MLLPVCVPEVRRKSCSYRRSGRSRPGPQPGRAAGAAVPPRRICTELRPVGLCESSDLCIARCDRTAWAHSVMVSNRQPRCSGTLQSSPTATCWSSWCRAASGPRNGFQGYEAGRTTSASSATRAQAQCPFAVASAWPCLWGGTCAPHRSCGRRHSVFPCPSSIMPAGLRESSCPDLWHNGPPDGLLEGHMFTDGSSSGSGALRHACWAVVAFDDWGNLKSAAYGAVPIDVLPEQTPAMWMTTLLPWQGQSPWTRKAAAQGHGSQRSRATRRKGTCRQGALLTCLDGEISSPADTHSGSPPWPSKLHFRAETTRSGAFAGDKGEAQVKRRAVRLAPTHRTLALLAGQSTRPTLLQGTQPQSGWQRQVWGSTLGEGRRAVPMLPETSWWVRFSAPQIEVWAAPEQTLLRLDSRGCSATFPGRGDDLRSEVCGPTTPAHKPASCHVARLGQRRPRGRSHRRAHAARA